MSVNDKHETELVIIKEEYVDKKIVPMIQFFNSFNGIITLYSCEGDEKTSPYISFICRNHNSLSQLVDALSIYCEQCFVPMEANFFEGTLTYVVRFENQEALLKATERMQEDYVC